jgi:hypothetical protein
VQKADKTNILEDDGDEVKVVVSLKGGKKIYGMEIVVRPFEVVTLRLQI